MLFFHWNMFSSYCFGRTSYIHSLFYDQSFCCFLHPERSYTFAMGLRVWLVPAFSFLSPNKSSCTLLVHEYDCPSEAGRTPHLALDNANSVYNSSCSSFLFIFCYFSALACHCFNAVIRATSASFLAAAIICAEEALFSLAFPPFCKLSYLSTSALTVGLTTHLFVWVSQPVTADIFTPDGLSALAVQFSMIVSSMVSLLIIHFSNQLELCLYVQTYSTLHSHLSWW